MQRPDKIKKQRDIQAQWDEAYQAIDENNADLLYTLLPPVNLHNPKEKYRSDNPGSIRRFGEDILSRAVDL